MFSKFPWLNSRKKLFSLMFFTFFLGCGGVELLPSTADDLILEINKLKSNNPHYYTYDKLRPIRGQCVDDNTFTT